MPLKAHAVGFLNHERHLQLIFFMYSRFRAYSPTSRHSRLRASTNIKLSEVMFVHLIVCMLGRYETRVC